MRKAKAQALWDKATIFADAAMKRLEDQGIFERVVTPDTDDEIAKAALHEAFKLALGARQRERSTCCRSAGAHIHEATAAYRCRDARPSSCQWRH
jgi:hypothetical protein